MTQSDVVTAPANVPAPAPATSPETSRKLDSDGNPYELDPDWPYDRLEYKGDKLAVRKASLQALMAYQLSSGKYIPVEKQNDASGLFITEHIGPQSYDRIIERMMSAGDPDYTIRSFGEIMGELVRMSIADIKANREELESAAQDVSTSG